MAPATCSSCRACRCRDRLAPVAPAIAHPYKAPFLEAATLTITIARRRAQAKTLCQDGVTLAQPASFFIYIHLVWTRLASICRPAADPASFTLRKPLKTRARRRLGDSRRRVKDCKANSLVLSVRA